MQHFFTKWFNEFTNQMYKRYKWVYEVYELLTINFPSTINHQSGQIIIIH